MHGPSRQGRGGPAWRLPCGAWPCGPGSLRCSRAGAAAMPPSCRLRGRTSRLLAGPPCGRTPPGTLRSSAPHRRRHAGPPRPCPTPPGTSTVNSHGASGKAAGTAARPPVRRRAPQRRGGSPAPQASDRREALRFWREGARTAASQPPRAARSAGDPARRAGRRSGGRAAVPAALLARNVERQLTGKGTTTAPSPSRQLTPVRCASAGRHRGGRR